MAFETPNYLGNVCPRYESDSSQYGAGTNYPVGYTIYKLSEIFWKWNNLKLDCSGNWSSSGDCDNSPCGPTYGTCSCYAEGGASSSTTNPRMTLGSSSTEITTMSQINCYGSYLTASKTETDGSSLSIIIDCRDIVCSSPITDTNWGTNIFYPKMRIQLDIPAIDGASDCDGYPGGSGTNCGAAHFDSIGTGTPSGLVQVGSVLISNACMMYGSGGYINPKDLRCEIPHPERCQGAEGYGSNTCGPDDDSVQCPFCGQGPFCGDPGAPAPPDCDDPDCPTLCAPICCSNAVGGCDGTCITSGCYSGDPLTPPNICVNEYGLCRADSASGTVFGTVYFDLTINPS